MEDLFILPLALVIDLVVGEYPSVVHPVVWIGQVISWGLRLAPRKNATVQFLHGLFMVILTTALFSASAYFLLWYLRGISLAAYVLAAAFLLKSCFSIRALCQAALKVNRLIAKGSLTEARRETGYLVSRDTRQLGEQHVISAVVEMSAESVTDSVVAPLFWWLLLGIPGAVAYRVINTFDSRIGYHGVHEYLGKPAARLDDALNYIPSRLSGLFLVVSAHLSSNGQGAWNIMVRDHSKTESPNAGWPMSAVAGALGVQLEKIGHYRLGDAVNTLSSSSIASGLKLVVLSSCIWVGICTGITGVVYACAA